MSETAGVTKLTGARKAAIFLISVGAELSAQIVKHLSPVDVEKLTVEISRVSKIDKEIRAKVFSEFQERYLAEANIGEGGLDWIKEVLERALGPQRAAEIFHRLSSSMRPRPFEIARSADPAQLMSFIQNEHPQTVALILAYLDPGQAAVLLSSLPEEKRLDVVRRLALMDRTSPEVVREIEKILEKKLSSLVVQEYTSVGGVQSVVDVLNRADRATEKSIIQSLELSDPELAEEIKKRMFVFEDIVLLDDLSLQRVLREVDYNRDLPMALKLSTEEVKQKIFRNMSSRAVENVKENMDYLGPVRLREVEEAQQKIVKIIRRLDEEGEIILRRQGEEIIV